MFTLAGAKHGADLVNRFWEIVLQCCTGRGCLLLTHMTQPVSNSKPLSAHQQTAIWMAFRLRADSGPYWGALDESSSKGQTVYIVGDAHQVRSFGFRCYVTICGIVSLIYTISGTGNWFLFPANKRVHKNICSKESLYLHHSWYRQKPERKKNCPQRFFNNLWNHWKISSRSWERVWWK